MTTHMLLLTAVITVVWSALWVFGAVCRRIYDARRPETPQDWLATVIAYPLLAVIGFAIYQAAGEIRPEGYYPGNERRGRRRNRRRPQPDEPEPVQPTRDRTGADIQLDDDWHSIVDDQHRRQR